jgi:hypothetical protein
LLSREVQDVPFALRCPGCNALLKAPDAAAGRTLLCPACKTPTTFPDKPPGTSPSVSAPTPPPAPAPPRSVSPPSTDIKPLIHTMPRMELDDDPPLEDREVEVFGDFAVDEAPLKDSDDEVFSDFDVIEGNAGNRLEEDVDQLEEVPEEGVDQLEEVEEELDQLEEVGSERDGYDFGWSRILRLSVIHVRAHAGHFGDHITGEDQRGYDLCDPVGRKVLGEAREIRSEGEQIARIIIGGRGIVPTRLEIREGRTGNLLATVRRPLNIPTLVTASVREILDPTDRVIGRYESTGWEQLTASPRYIMSPDGRKRLLKVQPYFMRFRITFATPQGHQLGEMMTESAYRGGGGKMRWFTRGISFYLRFSPSLDSRPGDKLLLLALAVGLDL